MIFSETQMAGRDDPFDGDIDDRAIAEWLEQFDEPDRDVALTLLHNFRYYSLRKVNELLRRLHADVSRCVPAAVDRAWFVPVGYVGKGGGAIALFYKKQNAVAESRFVSSSDLPRVVMPDEPVVFLDDFIGSGTHRHTVWSAVIEPIPAERRPTTCVFATLVGFEKGLAFLRDNTGFTVVGAEVMSSRDEPLAEDSALFPDPAQRDRARAILEKYGALAAPKHPLGLGETHALVGFFYGTPLNTFPIFWSVGESWRPLLARGEPFSDANRGAQARRLRRGGLSSLAPASSESSEEGEASELVSGPGERRMAEAGAPGKLGLINEVLARLHLDQPTSSALMQLVSTLARAQHEQRPICASLLLVPRDGQVDDIGLYLRTADGVTVRDREIIKALALLINGFEGGVVLKSDGTVVGNCIFPDSPERRDPFLPRRYMRAAAMSTKAGGLLFLLAGAGRIAVFENGYRVLSRQGAAWHLHRKNVTHGIAQLASIHDLPTPVLWAVMRLCHQLSDEGLGALVTLGDHDNVLRYADAPRIAHLDWKPMDLLRTSDLVLLGLLAQDGATIVSKDGTVLLPMAMLRPPAGGAGEVETGQGARHSSAAQISATTSALAIAVSADGPISMFSGGRMVLRLMG